MLISCWCRIRLVLRNGQDKSTIATDGVSIADASAMYGAGFMAFRAVDGDPNSEWLLPVRATGVPQPQHPITETKWEVFAPALTAVLEWVTKRYGPMPLYITENGAAFYDPPKPIEGRIDDPLRVGFGQAFHLPEPQPKRRLTSKTSRARSGVRSSRSTIRSPSF